MDPAAHPDLPAALRWLRHRGHLTQREAAAAAGVSLAYYKQLELGHRRPAPGTLDRLAGALGSDADELAGLLAHAPWAAAPAPAAAGPRTTRRTPKPAAYRQAARRALGERPGAAWSDPVAPAAAPPPPALAGEVAELVDHYVHLSRAHQQALLQDARRRRGA